ncbi:MAG: hypothetical protein ACOYK0_03220 [Candidatus Nanopelagicaceae bacterium]
MKKIISSVVTGALIMAGGIALGAPAHAAAATPTFVLSGGNGVYGLDPISIVATAGAEGTVKFMVGGVALTGCDASATTSVAPFVAKCAWTPAAPGAATLTATFTPKDATAFTVATSNTLPVKVGTPVQGVVSPIHIYVDEVLATGTTGALAPRFGQGCTVSSEYIIGQQIVFRVYANNADQGGAVMDSSNTASAFVQVVGMKDPLKLNYGNHSGVSFWTAVLNTGTAEGKYSTLGVIKFKVTMVAKDQKTAKVLSTKLAPKKVNGAIVYDAEGRMVSERVTYYRTVTMNPILKGAVGTWESNFTAASQLTLYAVPKA